MAAGFVVSKLEGHGGELWVGKATRAGSLQSWIVMPGASPGTWDFAGRLGEHDAYLMTQQPDSVRVPFGATQLRWYGVQLEIEGDRVRATLVGSPEER